jgi:hypothetical protein
MIYEIYHQLNKSLIVILINLTNEIPLIEIINFNKCILDTIF